MTLKEYFQLKILDQKATEFSLNYLRERGWFLTTGGESCNQAGPVPWITYPAFLMLERLVRPHYRVFEYGCGNSTQWWSHHVSQVVSVEHNRAWADKIVGDKLSNVTVTLRGYGESPEPEHVPIIEDFFVHEFDLPAHPVHNKEADIYHGLLCREFSGYAAQILNYPQGYFDIVVIDGMARVLTAWLSLRMIRNDGIIVFDDSERWQYNAAYRFLTESGFRRIDFWGPRPVQPYESCTSFFARDLTMFSGNPEIPRDQIADLGW